MSALCCSYAVQSLPLTEEGLQTWCKRRWHEKEQTLKDFYKNDKFVESTESRSRTVSVGDAEPDVSSVVDVNDVKALEAKRRVADVKARKLMLLALIVWHTFIAGIILVTLYYTFARYFTLVMVAFYMFMVFRFEGIDLFQIQYFNRFFSAKSSDKKKL